LWRVFYLLNAPRHDEVHLKAPCDKIAGSDFIRCAHPFGAALRAFNAEALWTSGVPDGPGGLSPRDGASTNWPGANLDARRAVPKGCPPGMEGTK